MLQKTILKDKAAVDVFKVMLGAVNPIQSIVGRFPTQEAFFFFFPYTFLKMFIILILFCNS